MQKFVRQKSQKKNSGKEEEMSKCCSRTRRPVLFSSENEQRQAYPCRKKRGGLAGRGQRLDFVFFQGFPGKGVEKKRKKKSGRKMLHWAAHSLADFRWLLVEVATTLRNLLQNKFIKTKYFF